MKNFEKTSLFFLFFLNKRKKKLITKLKSSTHSAKSEALASPPASGSLIFLGRPAFGLFDFGPVLDMKCVKISVCWSR